MTVFDDALAAITIDNADQVAAQLLQRVDEVHKQAATDNAALRVAIAARVAALRSTSTDATAFEASETARAATVTGTTPAATVAYLTLIRDELALLHTDLAKVTAAQVIGLDAVADLATVVGSNL